MKGGKRPYAPATRGLVADTARLAELVDELRRAGQVTARGHAALRKAVRAVDTAPWLRASVHREFLAAG
jgi:hypothetical protein